MSQSIENQTIVRCQQHLIQSIDGVLSTDAIKQLNADIGCLNTMPRLYDGNLQPEQSMASRIAVNELARFRKNEGGHPYDIAGYEAVLHLARRLLSPTGEAAIIMDEQVEALIPSKEELEAHSEAIQKDLGAVWCPPVIQNPTGWTWKQFLGRLYRPRA